ncbi:MULTISPECIES: response regulator [Enterobacteriaceae]|uniref:response regulator n=1 Tax=Enterobacteriaceae TaxID=543 RepID=UPI000497E980|nr:MULTISPECIES: response regulator [Enterobacteriaceae]QNE50922.1 response regulator [Klebsiella michiganensis]
MASVLLIDDDIELTAMLVKYLLHEGFLVTAVHDGESGVTEAMSDEYSIVVLDIMMPRQSGLDVLQSIRQKSAVPVLMLTARGDDVDKITGLNLGADDYVSKPCTPAELVARIRAILRRINSTNMTHGSDSSGIVTSEELKVGPLYLWPGSRSAQWKGQLLELTGTEFNLLEVLVRHAGQLVSKQSISLEAFNRPLARFDRRIDVHISSIRQKLGSRVDGQPWIQSVRGLGYQFLKD